MRTCAVGECAKKHHAHGWCQMHYKRWAVHGDPMVTLQRGRQIVTEWFCVCPVPVVGDFGECQTCYRKPRSLMA